MIELNPLVLPPLPAAPPARYLRRGAYEIAYFTLGPRTGRTVMLVHGLAASGLQFLDDAHWLADKGYFVVVPDLRGHGRSISPPSRSDADFTLEKMANDLDALLQELGRTDVVWVGNSLGGILALQLLGQPHPPIERLMMFGTSVALNVPRFMIEASALGLKISGRSLAARVLAPLTSADPKAQRLLSAIAGRIDADAVRRAALSAARYDLSANAAGFDGPVLIIKGKRDFWVNQVIDQTIGTFQNNPRFKLIALDKAGHCANLDATQEVRSALVAFAS